MNNELYFVPILKHTCTEGYIQQNVQDLCAESYKTLMREIKYINKRRAILCSWTETLNIVISCPQIDLYIHCNLNQNPSKLFVIRIEKVILKFTLKSKGPRIAKMFLKYCWTLN